MLRRVIAGFAVLLVASGCQGQSNQLDCTAGGKPIPHEVLVGNWTWTYELDDGTKQVWLRQFMPDGHVNLFVRGFTKPDAKWPNGLVSTRGTFGRWFISNRTWVVMMDGAYRAADPLGEKFYWVNGNGSQLPDGDARIIGDITPDSINVCFSNGQHYATMQRVDDKFELPEHFPPRSGR
ncbi:hypothetical protein [Nevskia ramosa]|uniref:hypothetical protein n=1 Tax=Nevskia ramosa TaxID=64002 RepID=UPI0003B79C3B|nr:hypothetical protein [Nevskia ramosa]